MIDRDDWARAQPHIEAALAYGGETHEIQDIQEACLLGLAHLWTSENSAAVTEIIQYPRIRTVRIWLAGGDLEELRDDIRPRIEAYALAEGAGRVEIAGRPGWKKALAGVGYSPSCIVISKELNDG
jgi:hypothetical protein